MAQNAGARRTKLNSRFGVKKYTPAPTNSAQTVKMGKISVAEAENAAEFRSSFRSNAGSVNKRYKQNSVAEAENAAEFRSSFRSNAGSVNKRYKQYAETAHSAGIGG